VGHVCVGVHRLDVPGRPLRVGGVLLADQHEGPLRHAPGGCRSSSAAWLLFSSSRTAWRRPSQPADDGLDQHDC
jgi:hypothetical protein